MDRKGLFTVLLMMLQLIGRGQGKEQAPYLQKPVLPSFRVLLADSSTWFTEAELKKGRPVLIMLFSPDCSHCQHQAEILTRNMEYLRETELLLTTYQPLFKMKEYISRYRLDQYPQVHVGRDVYYFFGPFFQLSHAPFLAVYDEKGNLQRVFDGGADIDRIREAIR